MTKCRTRWGPAIDRDLHGEKNDHALVECSWTWRIRTHKSPPRKDFSGLYENPTDEHGKPIENTLRTEFEESTQSTLDAQGYDAETDSATAMNAK